MALHTGQAKQSPLPAAVEATTRMTYRHSSETIPYGTVGAGVEQRPGVERAAQFRLEVIESRRIRQIRPASRKSITHILSRRSTTTASPVRPTTLRVMVLVLRVGPATRLLVGVRSGKAAAIDLHALDFEEAIDPVRSTRVRQFGRRLGTQ